RRVLAGRGGRLRRGGGRAGVRGRRLDGRGRGGRRPVRGRRGRGCCIGRRDGGGGGRRGGGRGLRGGDGRGGAFVVPGDPVGHATAGQDDHRRGTGREPVDDPHRQVAQPLPQRLPRRRGGRTRPAERKDVAQGKLGKQSRTPRRMMRKTQV